MVLRWCYFVSPCRPGTSLSTPQTSSKGSGSYDQGVRPVSQSGRPMTGFTRPSSSRPVTGSNTSIRDALASSNNRRVGTGMSRPMTTLGREVRLGTASLSSSSSGSLVDVDRLNIKKYAQRPGMGMALVDYLLYVEHNTRKALELCAEATQANDFKDWWWKARLGKCYFKLGSPCVFVLICFFIMYFLVGLYRDAEKQFRSSIKAQPIINTYLELCNVYMRLDLPNTAMDLLLEAS